MKRVLTFVTIGAALPLFAYAHTFPLRFLIRRADLSSTPTPTLPLVATPSPAGTNSYATGLVTIPSECAGFCSTGGDPVDRCDLDTQTTAEVCMQCIIMNEGANAENEFNWADANARIEKIQKSCGPQGNFDPYKLAKLRQRASRVSPSW